MLKKLASSGFKGESFRRKLYNFISKDSSSPSLSFIWETSEVTLKSGKKLTTKGERLIKTENAALR